MSEQVAGEARLDPRQIPDRLRQRQMQKASAREWLSSWSVSRCMCALCSLDHRVVPIGFGLMRTLDARGGVLRRVRWTVLPWTPSHGS